MSKIRRWLFAKLWYLTLWVAPVGIRAIVQRATDIGLTQMEQERRK